MSGSDAADLTHDAFLGGRLTLWQPRRGYRAGIDPVLLAAAVPARAGQSVLELGCGAGTAILCLATRVPGLRLWALELQPDYAALAIRNAAEAGLALDLRCGDLRDRPGALRGESFDHVLANPPFHDPARRTAAADPAREAALAEGASLDDWIQVAARRLAPRGSLSLIHRAERLPDLLAALAGRLGSVEVLPLAARTGRAPGLILVRARKGGRAAFRLHAPLVLHAGARHAADGEDYRPEIAAVLREAAALPWPA